MISRLFLLIIFPVVTLAQNILDEQGRKQGKWTKEYPNGELRYEGQFKNDVPVGIFKHYDQSGNITANLEYFNEGNSVAARLYHLNGKIQAIGLYSKQQKDSLWRYYNEKELLVSEETYRSGKLNGPSKTFYKNGKIAERFIYLDGLKDGEWKQFYEDGQEMVKCLYINNQLQGHYIRYYQDGRKEFEGRYKNDLKDGIWKFYLPNGKVDYELEYDNGLLLTELQLEDE